MSGAIPPLPNTLSWRGDQLKISTGTTLHLPLPFTQLYEYTCTHIYICNLHEMKVCCCEQSNEMSGSVKCGEFLDQLSDHQLLKADFPTCTYSVVFL
jgi:hypothetical protein